MDRVDSLLYSDDEDDGKSNMEEESGFPDDEGTEDNQKMLDPRRHSSPFR